MDNILDLITGVVKNNMGNIQEKLGTDKNEGIMSATSYAIPAILESLNGIVKSEDKATELSDILDKKYDGSKIGDIGSMISNYKSQDGLSIVKSLMGGNEGNIVKLISEKSGLGDTNLTTNFMGMLAPIFLQFLGKVKKESNLDAKGLTTLITSMSSLSKAKNGDIMGSVTNLLSGDGGSNILGTLSGLAGDLFKK